MMTPEDIDRILTAGSAPSRRARPVGAKLDERDAMLMAARILRQDYPLDARTCACAAKLEEAAMRRLPEAERNLVQPGEALLFVELPDLS